MHKKYHKKFKILDIPAVTTQAREGIETYILLYFLNSINVTTQAREGIETTWSTCFSLVYNVTTQAREGIETYYHRM